MWFATGIVMVYHRMPEVTERERLGRLEALDVSRLAVAPAEAAAVAEAGGRPFRLAMLQGRPVYRFGTTTVFADNGRPIESLSPPDVLRAAAEFAGVAVPPAAYDTFLTEPDQWTLQSRTYLPLHRVAVGDAEDTHIYVSDRSGEIVMRTTRSGRFWGYAGAVLHWLYFTPFRVHSELWAQTIIWLSVAGCVLTLSGLLWGLLRFSPGRRHRPRGRRLTRSPYTGLLRWHHYAGLLFGFFSFTWILSGGLSMDPWSWHPGTSPTVEQRAGVTLGPLSLEGIGAGSVRAGIAALAQAGPVKEVSVVRFRGEEYLVGRIGPAGEGRRSVSARDPAGGAFERFPDPDLIDAVVAAMPDIGMRDMTWLDAYDDYYYDRTGQASLPVLRITYADPRETALYFDPSRGEIVRKEERLTRINRWLYHGLHSLDFPFLYRRPLWDVVVIVLSLGGIFLAATTVWPGLKRVGRHARNVVGR
jgi:hypothetical protein